MTCVASALGTTRRRELAVEEIQDRLLAKPCMTSRRPCSLAANGKTAKPACQRIGDELASRRGVAVVERAQGITAPCWRGSLGGSLVIRKSKGPRAGTFPAEWGASPSRAAAPARAPRY